LPLFLIKFIYCYQIFQFRIRKDCVIFVCAKQFLPDLDMTDEEV